MNFIYIFYVEFTEEKVQLDYFCITNKCTLLVFGFPLFLDNFIIIQKSNTAE